MDMEAGDEALSQPHRAGPLPPALSTAPVTGVKRRRTLTTSSCGPDLHQALVEMVADRLNTNAGQPELTQYYEDQFLSSPVVGPPVSDGANACPESDHPPALSPQMRLRPRKNKENTKRPRHK